MTTAEMTESQFLSRLALDAAHDGEPSQGVVALSGFFRTKEWLECGLGFLLLVLASPVIAALILLVRLNSRGPGIFRQNRVGKRGVVFTMYKLRSMRMDAEAATGPAWSPSGADPRTTRLGHWLRRLHLDELPQLLNVARGEMSLVGPRPERPEFVHVLAEQIPGYLNRLMVHPGITGLAQINLPPDTDLNSVRRKLMLDCEYIRTASWWLDVRIVACTALRVLWIKGPAITRTLGLERTVFLAPRIVSTGNDTPVSLADLTCRTVPTVERPVSANDSIGESARRAPSAALPTELRS
jgi:lipopolysaccharide/colanic/teichoic acid biosynthesis glycosyltransferase